MRRRHFSLLFPVLSIGVAGLSSASADMEEGWIRRRLHFSLNFSNSHDKPLRLQRFWWYLPVRVTPTQRLGDVRVSREHRIHGDVLEHQVLELFFDDFPAYGHQVVTINVSVELKAGTAPQVSPSGQEWLKAERFVEVDASPIRGLALELRRDTEMETVRSIYEWVRHNIRYEGYLSEERGALHGLLRRAGDCTEYADLIVALARANGIPSRVIGGYCIDRDGAPRPQDYHNWAEVYLEGAWRLIDAQKGNWLAHHAMYVAFRIHRDEEINPIGHAHRYRLQGSLRVLL